MFVLAFRGMFTDLLHHVTSKYISFHDILRKQTLCSIICDTALDSFHFNGPTL